MAHLQALLKREHLLPRDRINLHFALGRVHDRAREFDEAFHHCEQGNACKAGLLERRGTAYQEDVHARLVDRIIAAFGPEHFERTRSFGVAAEAPVFIVGMPRSGTSLVEQILASHPAVHGAGELRLMKQFADDLPAELGGAARIPTASPDWTRKRRAGWEKPTSRGCTAWGEASRGSRTRCP